MNDNIRHMVSSIDLSSGSFVDKHRGVQAGSSFTSTAIFQAVCREPGFPAEHLTTQALFTRSQSDGGTVCSSTGAKGAPLCSQPLWPPIIC